MTLKQIQKIGFDNCDFESTFGSSNYYAEPTDLEPQLPTFRDLRNLLCCSNYSKQEIRDFFKAKYAIKYQTANDGRAEWLNTKGDYLYYGF